MWGENEKKDTEDLGVNAKDSAKVEESAENKTDAPKEDPPKEEVSKEEPPKEDPPKEEVSKEEPVETRPEYEVLADKMMEGQLDTRPDIKRELKTMAIMLTRIGGETITPELIAFVLIKRGYTIEY